MPNSEFPAIMLLRMYMNQGKYQDAFNILDSHFNQNSLETERINSWKQNSKEDIYFISTDKNYDYVKYVEWMGVLFLRALKMIIIPLVLSSLIIVVASMGRSSDLG